MTHDQTIALLKSNKDFLLNFCVDNNTDGFVSKLTEMGYGRYFVGADNRVVAKQIVKYLIENKKTSEVKDIFNSVKYLDNDVKSAEYTKGYRDYFLQNTPTELVNNSNYVSSGRLNFDGLMAAAGAALTTYSSVATGGQTSSSEELQKAQQEAEDAKKRTRTYLIVGVVVVVITIGVVIFVSKKNNN